jgi:GWxTD domain-containing protein
MKNLILFLIVLSGLSNNHLYASDYVRAQLFYSNYYSPTEGPYFETYLSVVGSSVVFVKNDTQKFQGAIEVTMIFKKDSLVVAFDKYELLSPEVSDTSSIDFNFLDQQRFSLPDGVYDFEIQIKDINGNKPPFITSQTVEINFPKNEISISGIELIESYSKTTENNILSKSGLDLVPYVYNFYPDRINTLRFYAEVYNTKEVLGNDGMFLLSYFIENYENQQRLTDYVRFKRETASPVTVLFSDFDITNLPSGNYHIVIEARDRENNILASNKLFFQRSNPEFQPNFADIDGSLVENSFVAQITDKDTLLDYIHSLAPISTYMEQNFVKYQIDQPTADLELMQRFFLSFWLNRDNLKPEYAWKEYLSAVELVDEQFGYPGKRGKKGYETDMGRIFLKYGPPNTITDRPFDASSSGMTINNGGTPSSGVGAVPYQIWHYYTLDNQRNKKFVFANSNPSTFDYTIIHSNVSGEIQNANWQDELRRIKEGTTLPDNDTYNGESGDFYNNPR